MGAPDGFVFCSGLVERFPGDSVQDLSELLNEHSLDILPAVRVEPSLASAPVGMRYQFERLGYFAVDPDSRPGALVFNRTVSLKDTWSKIAGR